MLRGLSLTAANFLLLALLVCQINGQETQSRKLKSSPKQPEFSGLITSRLSLKELDRWKTIERIAFAEDARRQPLHPTLRNLWQWIETSGHAVFVEINRSTRDFKLHRGKFRYRAFRSER